MTETFASAARVHTALTASYEKRLLLWLARHTPAPINSDHLTALAFAAQVCAGAAYAMARHNPRALWLVNLLIALNWLGDSLDGTLARVRDQQRPRYGFYVDHIVDILGALALIAGLGFSGFVHWPIAIGMLLCFYVLSIESFLATYTLGRFHISHGPFGPTEIRMLLIVGNLLTLLTGLHDLSPLALPMASLAPVSVFDVGLVLIGSLAPVVLGMLFLRDLRAISLADPSPVRRRQTP